MIPTIALSVRQPWAWAILHAGKDVENRSAAAVRHGMKPGRIALHAAKGMTRAEYEHAAGFMASIGVRCPAPTQLIRGGIIGSVTVSEIVSDHPSEWFFGPRGLVLECPSACPAIPSTGALGFFKWTRSEGSLATPAKWMRAWNETGTPLHEPAPADLPLFTGAD